MERRIEHNLLCPVCLEIFKDPVMLPCTHSVCRTCVQGWWEDKRERLCPVCRKKCRLKLTIPSNLALKNVCEAYLEPPMELGPVCSLHREKLLFLCLDHQEPVCHICKDRDIHAGHEFHLLDKVAKDHKEKLQGGLQKVTQTLEYYSKIRDNCFEQSEFIKVQRDQVERKIKKDFEALHYFLQVEEKARLSAVMEEEQKKSLMMKKKIEALNGNITALLDKIRTAEELQMSDHVSLVKNFQTAMTKIQELPEKHELPSGALLDEAKHVGNLKFSVWEKMKEIVTYSPVIFDPNTAGPEVSLSEDLTSVSSQVRPDYPKNPERYRCNAVLGSALTSGTHIWDVEVGDNTDWEVGVVWGDLCWPISMCTWGIAFCDDKYIKFDQPFGSWNPPVKLQRVRVHVDTDKGSISFSESLTNVELGKKQPSHWPRLSCKKKMFPLLSTKGEHPLKVIPLPPRVTIQSQK
ncbi:E3 ubiquitin-protein ligase TRIM35-like [Vanacampus margaritifer]